MTYATTNPTTAEVEARFAETGNDELQRASARAHETFQADWRRRTVTERAEAVGRLETLLIDNREKLARLATIEMGKLIEEARGEVDLSAAIFRYYADNAVDFLEPTSLDDPSGEARTWIEHAPLGVLVGVQPWNFPYYQLSRFAAPNIVLGNVVIVKHAASVPQCAEAFAGLFEEAGFPPGVYTNVRPSHDALAALIADDRIRGVALTGSEKAGAIVAANAGKALKKSVMELGGSDPFIVLDDADLDTTVKAALWARRNNNGQSCVAAKRFIVADPIADAFLDRLAAEYGEYQVGDPLDESTTLGPVSSEGAMKGLLEQIEQAAQHGATVRIGGSRIDRDGYFVEPTILTDVAPDNPAYRQEFFGPVLLFFRVSNDDEAIALANDSPFGLGGSIFTTDQARGRRMAERIESGMVFVNRPTWTAPELPFGGVKNSGYGRELSHLGIGEFVNRKLFSVSAPGVKLMAGG